MVTGVTVPRSLIFFNKIFVCFVLFLLFNDAEKGIAMYMHVCLVTVHTFELFINDIIIL